MKTFTDAAGRTWTISLTIGSARRVLDKLGVNLLKPDRGDPPLLTQLGTDELLLAEVVCCLLESQFEAHKVTEQDVYDAFDGPTLSRAHQAFYEELVDFFRSDRPDIARAVSAQQTLIEKAVRAVEAKIEAIDLDEEIRGAMSGSSPEPSASIPGR